MRVEKLLALSLGSVFGLILVLFVALLVYIECGEHATPEETDQAFKKYEKTFTPGRQGFEGIDHDLDLNIYTFAFRSLHDESEFFRLVDSGATAAGWELVKSGDGSRTFSRPSDAFPAATGYDVVTLEYERKSGRIVFEVKCFQWSKSGSL